METANNFNIFYVLISNSKKYSRFLQERINLCEKKAEETKEHARTHIPYHISYSQGNNKHIMILNFKYDSSTMIPVVYSHVKKQYWMSHVEVCQVLIIYPFFNTDHAVVATINLKILLPSSFQFVIF